MREGKKGGAAASGAVRVSPSPNAYLVLAGRRFVQQILAAGVPAAAGAAHADLGNPPGEEGPEKDGNQGDEGANHGGQAVPHNRKGVGHFGRGGVRVGVAGDRKLHAQWSGGAGGNGGESGNDFIFFYLVTQGAPTLPPTARTSCHLRRTKTGKDERGKA